MDHGQSPLTRLAGILRTFRKRGGRSAASVLARIEDLRQGDLVKVDCAACHHVALLTPDFPLRLGLSPYAKVLDLKWRVRCRGCGARAGRRVDQVGAPERESRACRWHR
jgi:hypothetical protein